jgi:Fic family protein
LASSRLSFYALTQPALRERESALTHLSGRLFGQVAPDTRQALAETLAGINSYYSNLIEGQSTRPIEAEHWLRQAPNQVPNQTPDEANRLALAHIRSEQWLRQRLRDQPDTDLTHPEAICALHRHFIDPLPPSMRSVSGAAGQSAANVGGELRQQAVIVGQHLPPEAADIPTFLKAFHEATTRQPRTFIPILLAHHRLVWIHPFLDGNGRIARLLTTAQLAQQGLDAGGLWSLSRGLAKRRADYYQHLAHADSPRSNDFDGRGALSAQAAQQWVKFLLQVCEDQMQFMAARLDFSHFKDRLERFCAERKLLTQHDPRAAAVLLEAFSHGRVPRAAVPRLLDLGERAARNIVAECLKDGLLIADNHRADLSPRYPVYAAAYLFPHLFEIDNPQATMRESLALV